MATDIQKEVMSILNAAGSATETALAETLKISGKNTVRDLNSTSPKRSGKYAKGWTYKVINKGEVIVYNKSSYRLTHLLEKGHATMLGRGKGRYTYGYKARTKAQPHIAPAEQRMKERIEGILEDQIDLQMRKI